jgi:preprotein translocase subunit SecE
VTTDALSGPKRGWLGRVLDFLRDVRGEVRKVTWPV